MRTSKFIKSQKILRIATIDSHGEPHIVPVWFDYVNKKFYVGTNSKTIKAKNIKRNSKVSFCVDTGINSPDIFGVMGIGKGRLILENSHVKSIAKKILRRYFKSLKDKSALQLLEETDCIIEIIPKKIITWKF